MDRLLDRGHANKVSMKRRKKSRGKNAVYIDIKDASG